MSSNFILNLPVVELVTGELVNPATTTVMRTTLIAGTGTFVYKVRNLWKMVEPFFLLFSLNDLRVAVNTTYLKEKGAGYIGHYFMGDAKGYRLFTRLFLVAATVVRAMERTESLKTSITNWKLYAWASYTPPTMKLNTNSNGSFLVTLLGPSTAFWAKHNFNALVFKISNVGYYTLIVIKDGFLASMAYADAFQAWTWNRDVGDEANIDIVRNIRTVFNNSILTQEKAINLISSVCEKARITEMGLSTAFVVQTTATLIKGGVAVYDGGVKIAEKTDNILVKTVQNGVFGLASLVGVNSLLPATFVPKAEVMVS